LLDNRGDAEVTEMSRNLQYVTDENGRKTAVILPIEDYEELLEDLHLIRVHEENKNDERIPLSELLTEMREAGEVDV
jgi:PHD/YefM family antitoxin component YafN of YafNO toxin-antitoxin module